MPNATLRTLADDYWDAYLEMTPTYATIIGDRRFDDQIEELSVEAEATQKATLQGLRVRLDAIDTSSLDQRDRVTAALLGVEIDNGIEAIDFGLVEQAWDQIAGIHADLLLGAPQYNAPTPESAAKLVARFRQIPRLLDQATVRFRNAVAKGITPTRIAIERSLSLLDGYLVSPVAADPYVTFPGPERWDGETRWREELVGVVRDVMRPAFARYRDLLADELAPIARPDDRPGVQWIPGGPALYEMLVRRHTSLDLDPEEIHEIGMADITEKLPSEYAEVGERLFGLTDQADIFDRLRTDPTLRYGDADEIMADARRYLAAAAAVMADWFGRLPQAECELKPVPDFAAADRPGAYYYPPASDGSRPGTYFVNLYNPSQKTRYDAASIAYHEAIPGHHLQLAIADELEGLPAFQRLTRGHTAYVEGWGLYSERLADEMGLYADDIERLGMLAADSMRSCRLVVDTGLHTKGWSRQQAIDFFAAHCPLSIEEITVEVDRYIVWPGQALAYKLGQREIFLLRDEAKRQLDGRFDIKGFHDTVLGSSRVTMPILGELVADWVATTNSTK